MGIFKITKPKNIIDMKKYIVGSKKTLLLMPYFGKWPEWFPLFLESCRWNSQFNWLFFTDCGIPDDVPSNVRFVQISFDSYLDYASKRLGIKLNYNDSYKLCDLRPALGFIHEEELHNYRNFGYGDIDVIYGRLCNFLTDEVLDHQCISTHMDRVSGHFALFKVCKENIHSFKKIPKVRKLMSDPKHHSVCEIYFSHLFLGKPNCFFKEQYSTIFSNVRLWIDGTQEYPKNWYWKDGRLTNDKDRGREFMYLHFMNWKSSRWIDSPSAWELLTKINHVRPGYASKGFKISSKGFHELSNYVSSNEN